jgi:hypothetical protein
MSVQRISNSNFLSTPVTSINGYTVDNSVISTNVNTSTPNADISIFPVNKFIKPVNVTYDGQTILFVNSANSNQSTTQGQYFDSTTSTPPGGWSYNFQSYNMFNGSVSYSSLISTQTSLYQNLTNSSGQNIFYSLDFTNNNNPVSTPKPYNALFFSLTANPYTNYFPVGTPNLPTITNINPNYNGVSDNYIFVSNYYIPQLNEILVCEVVFSIANSGSANVNSSASAYTNPSISCIVTNRVITQEQFNDLNETTINNPKIKKYTAGPMPISFVPNGEKFDPKVFSYSSTSNIPLVIANGFTKVYMSITCMYVPPFLSDSTYYGQFVEGQDGQSSTSGAYYIDANGSIVVNSANLSRLTETVSNQTNYGHFCLGVAYSTEYPKYSSNLSSGIQAEVLIKNIWRSPVSLYNTYSSYSVTDMATKQFVILFGKSANGGTFLVTNTGTPFSSIDNYAVTSLKNFMSIMRAIMNEYNGSNSIVDYFINASLIQKLNNTGLYSIQPLVLQPLNTEGSITNTELVTQCPGMNFFFLNSKNSGNLIIDPNEQNVFSSNIIFSSTTSSFYLGIPNSVLSCTGNIKYGNTQVNSLVTNNRTCFGNSLFLGQQIVNNISYYVLILLPESLFNLNRNIAVTNLSLYSTLTSEFYLSTSSANTYNQFTSASNSVTVNNVSTNTSSTIGIAKIILSVSNTTLPLITT